MASESYIWLPFLRLNPPTEGSPGTISVKFSVDVKGWPRYRTAQKIAENFYRLSRVHERYRQTTDGRAISYSERERELAKTARFQ